MHLLISFASCRSEGCASALPTLSLPRLEKLLRRLTPEPMDTGDEFSLSPPHERTLARALGISAPDGLIPWAALEASKTMPAEGAWGFISPCHWQVGTNHIAMSGQALPDFSSQESQTLMAAMQPYFEEDGITLYFVQPDRWLAHAALFNDMATASLDRVLGRNVEHWIPRTPNAAGLRRLQSEMQMLLYTHPVNEARAARGAVPVNSFWLSGTGALANPLRLPASDSPPIVLSALRESALNEDWASWAKAWQAVDATQCADLLAALDQGGSHQLTLCGERSAQSFTFKPQSIAKRLLNLFSPPNLVSQLKQL